jgi:hypothetical protein
MEERLDRERLVRPLHCMFPCLRDQDRRRNLPDSTALDIEDLEEYHMERYM